MNLTGHMLIKNEERWIWFAINSVLPYLSKLIIFDTGSTDNTLKIIQKINSPKIILKKRTIKNRQSISKLRNQMISLTSTKWFVLVDGDEIWPSLQLKKLISQIKNTKKTDLGIVSKTRNCVGDIFHFQPDQAGRYTFGSKTGHYTIRAYKRSPKFAWKGQYPHESYSNQTGQNIATLDKQLIFSDTYYYHTTHLKRSTKSGDKQVVDRPQKYKLEIGIKAPKSELPEVIFEKYPPIVQNPTTGFTMYEQLLAHIYTPLRKIKRLLV